jgi:hypothetical protein
VNLSLLRGESGLVFDGGDPHQGRSVGFYPAIKMDKFNDNRKVREFYDADSQQKSSLIKSSGDLGCGSPANTDGSFCYFLLPKSRKELGAKTSR